MTQIINMVLDALVAHLTTTMITNIADKTTKATLVKKGLLQVDKIASPIEIGITGGDHENPDYRDGIVTLGSQDAIAMELPAREIGGGQFWVRRGVARLECFFVTKNYSETVAHEKAYDILGRLSSEIEQCAIGGMTDDYGEIAGRMYCFGNTFFQSGGPPDQYIFRGKILWQFFTERP
jgi:hypothetical protein